MTMAAYAKEWLLLRGAERTVLAYTPEQRERVMLHTGAADARARAARTARSPALDAVATELARQALVHRVLAFVAATGKSADDALAACDLPKETAMARTAIAIEPDTLGFERMDTVTSD